MMNKCSDQLNTRNSLPYILLSISILPIAIGYAWILIATFSMRTEGLIPRNADGQIGGFTLQNWEFLNDPTVWQATLNSFLIAISMVIGIGFGASLTGYALSRMNFRGRKGFLTTTLIVHGFRPELLLIAIFQVLLFIGGIPVVGNFVGFNTVGGVALVEVTLGLPLGIWLMKGFFDNIPWDVERAALIDGASRFRVWWEILLPQILPGLAALSIFNFIGGWNAYLVPATFTIGSETPNLPVLLNQFSGDTSLSSWNTVAALGLFQLIPILIFFLFTQDALLNMYGGGTKGGN